MLILNGLMVKNVMMEMILIKMDALIALLIKITHALILYFNSPYVLNVLKIVNSVIKMILINWFVNNANQVIF